MEIIPLSLVVLATFMYVLETNLPDSAKNPISDRIRKFSHRIRQTTVPDIHRRCAYHIDNYFSSLWSNKNKALLIVYAILWSAVLTLLAIIIGHNLDKKFEQYQYGLELLKLRSLLTPTIITAIVMNIIFDLTSLRITKHHISLMKSSSGFRFPFILIRDILTALGVALLLIVVTYYGSIYFDSNMSLGIGDMTPILDVINLCIVGLYKTITANCNETIWLYDTWIPYSYFTFSLTAFVPTLLLALFLFSAYAAHYLLLGYVKFLKHYVNIVFEKGAIFGPVAAVIAFFAALCQLSIFIAAKL